MSIPAQPPFPSRGRCAPPALAPPAAPLGSAHHAMPTLRHKNRPAEQAAVRCCRRRLPVRRPALFRIRPAAKVLFRETGHRPYRDTSAGKRPARIRRPQHFMERRGSCGEPVELPACPAFYHGTAKGTFTGRLPILPSMTKAMETHTPISCSPSARWTNRVTGCRSAARSMSLMNTASASK